MKTDTFEKKPCQNKQKELRINSFMGSYHHKIYLGFKIASAHTDMTLN